MTSKDNSPRPWIHEDELDWAHSSHAPRYGSKRKQLAAATGGQQLGCSLYELEPGLAAWPKHYHLANEEAIYVLSGQGTLELGDEHITLSPGIYASLRIGQDHAHRITSTGAAPLRYLCFSTMQQPDITVYPEQQKLGLFAGAAPGGDKAARTLNLYLDANAEVGYWDGE